MKKTPFEPELVDILIALREDVSKAINCVKVGEIKSFNRTKKTATVQILFKRVSPSGATASVPVLLDVPVFTLQGGGGSLQFPIAAGDQCVVLFSDRDIDTWFQTGSEAPPKTSRAHDMSDAIALVGLNSLASSLAAYPALTVSLKYSGAEVFLKSGKITIKNGTTDLLAIVNALFVAIEAIQVTGNLALTPASITALEVVKAQFATLLGTP